MTWWAYVQRHSRGSTNVAIAAAVGITASSVGRWKVSTPDPAHTAAFARPMDVQCWRSSLPPATSRSEEAGASPAVATSLGTFTDIELLAEVAIRMQQAPGARSLSPGPRRAHFRPSVVSCPDSPVGQLSARVGGPKPSHSGTPGDTCWAGASPRPAPRHFTHRDLMPLHLPLRRVLCLVH